MAATRPFSHGRLACGCAVGFRQDAPGVPVTVMIDEKSQGCPIASHIAGAPVYDHREPLRPATRPLPPLHTDFEE